MSEVLSKINSLAIFRDVRQKEPFQSLITFLERVDEVGVPQEKIIEAYSEFVGSVYEISSDGDFSECVKRAVLDSDNPYRTACIEHKKSGGSQNISALLSMMADNELKVLDEIASLSYPDLSKYIFYDGYIPQFKSSGLHISKSYKSMLDRIA
ncbi:MAG: hypothetical protein J5778_10605 [Clostridiales bacterium]|nr:hypothetical protein [Clostridiales bacterium]